MNFTSLNIILCVKHPKGVKGKKIIQYNLRGDMHEMKKLNWQTIARDRSDWRKWGAAIAQQWMMQANKSSDYQDVTTYWYGDTTDVTEL